MCLWCFLRYKKMTTTGPDGETVWCGQEWHMDWINISSLLSLLMITKVFLSLASFSSFSPQSLPLSASHQDALSTTKSTSRMLEPVRIRGFYHPLLQLSYSDDAAALQILFWMMLKAIIAQNCSYSRVSFSSLSFFPFFLWRYTFLLIITVMPE